VRNFKFSHHFSITSQYSSDHHADNTWSPCMFTDMILNKHTSNWKGVCEHLQQVNMYAYQFCNFCCRHKHIMQKSHTITCYWTHGGFHGFPHNAKLLFTWIKSYGIVYAHCLFYLIFHKILSLVLKYTIRAYFWQKISFYRYFHIFGIYGFQNTQYLEAIESKLIHLQSFVYYFIIHLSYI